MQALLFPDFALLFTPELLFPCEESPPPPPLPQPGGHSVSSSQHFQFPLGQHRSVLLQEGAVFPPHRAASFELPALLAPEEFMEEFWEELFVEEFAEELFVEEFPEELFAEELVEEILVEAEEEAGALEERDDPPPPPPPVGLRLAVQQQPTIGVPLGSGRWQEPPHVPHPPRVHSQTGVQLSLPVHALPST